MDFNFKRYIEEIKSSKLVVTAKKILKPVMDALKTDAKKVILWHFIALVVVNVLAVGIVALLKFICGLMGIYSYSRLNFIGLFAAAGSLTIIDIIANIIDGIAWVITNLLLINATYVSFRDYVHTGRVVSFGEYLGNTKVSLDFAKRYTLEVLVPTVAFICIGKGLQNTLSPMTNGLILDYISPYAAGLFIARIIRYPLMFRFYAKEEGFVGDDEMIKHASHWLTFAVCSYILNQGLQTVYIFEPVRAVFVLFTLLYLHGHTEDVYSDAEIEFDIDEISIGDNSYGQNYSNREYSYSNSYNNNSYETRETYSNYISIDNNTMREFIGKNADYYMDKFEEMDREDKKISFNLWALVGGFYWYLYRKMYIQALIVFGASCVLGPLVSIANALFGNYVYKKHVNDKLQMIANSQGNPRELIEKHGGVNLKLVIIILAIVAVIVGLLMFSLMSSFFWLF